MDEMLGMKDGKESSKKQPMKSRRDESVAMKKSMMKNMAKGMKKMGSRGC